MEILNPTIPNNPQILPRASVFSPKHSIATWRKNAPLRFTIPFSKSPINPPFLLYRPLSHSKKFQISAHFGQHTGHRRNYLREKLTEQQQVRHSPLIYEPSSDFEIPTDKFDIDSKSIVESNSSVAEKKAHFGRLTGNRRNSLRKKLTEQQRIRQSPVIYEPSSDFQNPVDKFDTNSNGVLLNLDSDALKEGNFESNSHVGEDIVESGSLKKLKGDSVMLKQLESWADQYKADSEFWGVGSDPIFTLFQDSNGKVERVVVNEDEILRRSGVEPSLYKKSKLEDFKEAKLKISHARSIARETEIGNHVFKNSSIAKFVVNSSKQSVFFNGFKGLNLKQSLSSRNSRIGIAVLCGSFVFLALNWFVKNGKKTKKYTPLQKEMLRRKMKARMDKENSVKGSVEVLQDSQEPQIELIKRPEIDKQEIVASIMQIEASRSQESVEFDNKIEEIRVMARRAREIEKKGSKIGDGDSEDDQTANKLPEVEVIQHNGDSDDEDEDEDDEIVNKLPNEKEVIVRSGDHDGEDDPTVVIKQNGSEKMIVEVQNDSGSGTSHLKEEYGLNLSEKNEVRESSLPEKQNGRVKPRVIRSVKEAREYLALKREKQEKNQEPQFRRIVEEVDSVLSKENEEESDGNRSRGLDENDENDLPISNGKLDFTSSSNDSENITFKREESVDEEGVKSFISNGNSDSTEPTLNKENCVEKNSDEFEAIAKKIGVGFKDNYMVAKEKANSESSSSMEMIKPKPEEDDGELDWMKDEKLREIVFQVRENELLGRDPFYLMDAEDKNAFFEGLEKNVEKMNEKLQPLHEYLHSNIENLDYGAAGISVYDPPEKFIPRWKGPPLDSNPEFLNDYAEQRNALIAQSLRKNDGSKSNESLSNTSTTSKITSSDKKLPHRDLKPQKTVIEGSDGSLRAGKKSGKEYWAHTKKWSRDFLDSYNAETDPEVKAVMRDIGKDLDRWITEEEVKEAATLMDPMPKRRREIIEAKLHNFKREMNTYGPQAVVNKYSEYEQEKEVDYFWWLDLPFILCIELQTIEDGVEERGFYSLEMAAELELNPKQYHVIGFQDTGDCKNFCYIIQSHMEMEGTGNAFVVARPPKEAYREAKASGYGVTVIKKGEIQMNVDQTLDEVEEQITEIGTKMYQDKITKGRSVDINSLMEGVFGTNKKTKRTPITNEGKQNSTKRKSLKQKVKELKQLEQKLKQIKLKRKPNPTNQ